MDASLRKEMIKRYKSCLIFGLLILCYIFRGGFWGVDFLGLCYALFLCLPFFIFFSKASFGRLYAPVLTGIMVIWAVLTDTYPIFWLLLPVCFYGKSLLPFGEGKSDSESRLQFFKLETAFLLFASTYESLKATWYMEPIGWVRLYALFAGVVLIYAGWAFFLRDIRMHQKQRQMREADEKKYRKVM